MSDFEVKGAEDFLKLSKALKAAGRTKMRSKLNREIKKGAKPLLKVAVEAAREAFPKRGGLAEREAEAVFRIAVYTGRDPGVRIVAHRRYTNLRLSNDYGRIRHPVFADPEKTRREWKWVDQPLPDAKGWFDKAMQEHVHEVRPAVERAVRSIVDDIVREAQR